MLAWLENQEDSYARALDGMIRTGGAHTAYMTSTEQAEIGAGRSAEHADGNADGLQDVLASLP